MPRSDTSGSVNLCCGMAAGEWRIAAAFRSSIGIPVPIPSPMARTGAVADADERRRWDGRAQLDLQHVVNGGGRLVSCTPACRIRRSDAGMLQEACHC
jgi:hypothetical protein